MAAEFRGEPSEDGSEERTEPFSQSELDNRLKSIYVEPPIEVDGAPYASVPLDLLRVEDHHHKQGIRILVRPLTRSRSVSPFKDNCQWLALRAEVAPEEQPQHQVLAVTQTAKDINFSMRIPPEMEDDDSPPRPPLWCELYYDPASDDQILLNRSDVPIALAKATDPETSPVTAYIINPGTTRTLKPGSWRISVEETAVLDFRILEKRPATLFLEESVVIGETTSTTSSSLLLTSSTSIKRSFSDDEPTMGKKPRTLSDVAAGTTGTIMFLPIAAEVDPIVFPLPHGDGEAGEPSSGRELTVVDGHPLLDTKSGEMVELPGIDFPNGGELDRYQLTKRDQIASTSLSSVFTAKLSSAPNGIVTVKVLKTRLASQSAKQVDTERNVIRQADMWLREYESQDDLNHKSIVRLYGGDARYLSLYMEHIDAPDLASRDRWRDRTTDLFCGTRADAIRILRDIAGALHYIHGRRLVHNDIKPANILYSPERGAVLCDFGLSTAEDASPTAAGTPYYVPPEFIGQRLRGPPSDVWALGVVMLYVLRRITFPDGRATKQHPRQLYWMIADLNRPVKQQRPVGRPGMNAAEQMRLWLEEIASARAELNRGDRLERLVAEMLWPNPKARIKMDTLIQELFADGVAAMGR